MEVEKQLAEGEMVSDQYCESTGIQNGGQRQFRSTSAAGCVSHLKGEASCSTTALSKSIILRFVVCVCEYIYLLSVHKPKSH